MDPAIADLEAIYKRGDLVLFVGAGVSAAAGLPSWPKLADALVDRAKARGVDASSLAEIADLVGRSQLIDALSALKESLGPNDFCDAVEKLVDDDNIEELPDVAKAIGGLRNLRAVLTTNLDHLLERAFVGAWPALARATADIATRRRFILKLHGTRMDRSTWVFTREEYDRAMYADERLKNAFSAFFSACTLLFVGYGLTDDDFDAILARMRAFAGDQAPRHFALVESRSVTPFRKSKLEKAGVRLIPYENADGCHTDVPRILRGLTGAAPPPPPPVDKVLSRDPPGETRQVGAVTPTDTKNTAAPRAPLPDAEIKNVHAAAIQVGLSKSRDVLLEGINLSVLASLPIETNPSGQIYRDLMLLNRMVLLDGSAPLAIWLANALTLVGPRVESAVFSRALAAIEASHL